MKKINLKSPKYIIPLIILPFLVGINWLVIDTFSHVKAHTLAPKAHDKKEINTVIPGANLTRKKVLDKFEAFKDAFKSKKDFSAIREIEEEEQEESSDKSQYTEEEKQMIDSINNAVIDGKKEGFSEAIENKVKSYNKRSKSSKRRRRSRSRKKRETAEEKELRLLREQMRILDSLTNHPGQKELEQALLEKNLALENLKSKVKAKENNTVVVSKIANPDLSAFNTIKKVDDEKYIKAIVDESLTVVDGSRIRIRLLDDVLVGDLPLEKGSYIYATVSSFGKERIYGKVETILVKDEIVPVELVIYDADGIKGFYIPSSNFQEFTQSLSSDVVNTTGQTMTVQGIDPPGSLNEILFGIANRGLQTSTKATARALRKNKGKLKYNSQIYLVNPQQLKK